MNGDRGYTAGRFEKGRTSSQPRGQGGNQRRRVFVRLAIPALAMAALSGFGGCTFVEQAEDAMAGGPAKRVEAAEQRQREAMARQGKLEQARQDVMQQQAVEVESLMAMRKQLEDQNARLVRLRADQRVAEEEERRLHRRITSLNGEIQSLELALRASRTTGETQSAEDLEQKLRALRLEAEQLEQEIRSLEQ